MQRRLLVSIALGLIACATNLIWLTMWPNHAWDFTWPLRGAQLLLQGYDPYALPLPDLPYPPPPLFYPLPAVLIALPFSPFPDTIAAALFTGCSTALLAFGLTRDGTWWRLSFLLSPSYLIALRTIQWSPLLTAAALLPVLAPLWIAKPNLGVPLLIRAPRWRSLVGMALFAAASLVVLPSWPIGWWHNLEQNIHTIPLLSGGGFLVLLALIQWRDPAARLLVSMAIMPQRLLFYDQLPLWLCVTSLRQSMVLSICGWLGTFLWVLASGEPPLSVDPAWVIAILYLPALAIVLWSAYRQRAGTPSAPAEAPAAATG